jgi:toxin HigB-1
MIRSFRDQETEIVFVGERSKKFPTDMQNTAFRKLGYVHAAVLVTDLRMPPGNRLEKLEGSTDEWSIRVNDQWRVLFRWIERDPDEIDPRPKPGDAFDVEISNHYAR